MSRAKPDSVDANAWWSASDDEWVLGDKDDEGAFHGRVTYWRPDGSLVNHCHFVHGTPHGEYARYHPSGEVSRKGTFVKGQLQGTDVFIRSKSPTTENFPAGLGEGVWRAEMDMVAGRMVGGRLYDENHRQVAEDGTPCPDRPEGVPDDAVYSSTGERWLVGATDEAHLRDGLWRFYTQEGWVEQEIEYAAGEIRSDTVYANRFAARAAQALREGDAAECDSAVSDGLTALEDAVDQLELLAIQVRSLKARGDRSQAAERASFALDAHPVSMHWGRFTKHGRRGFTAMAELEAFVAEDHLDHERGEEALAWVRRAIDHHPQASAPLHLLKGRALQQLGRDDEYFSSVKKALALDDSLEALAPFVDDPRYAAWLEAIDPGSMTVEGAWAILGEAGEKLDQYVGVLVEEDADDEEASEAPERTVFTPDGSTSVLDVPLDLDVLPTCSPELRRFAELAPVIDICSYRGEYVPVCESGLDAAVQTMDGNWLARIQSVFLPASLVSIDDESMILASWMPTSRDSSLTWAIHQDEPQFYFRKASISAAVVDLLELDEDDQMFAVPERVRQRWSAAADLHFAEETLDAPLGLLALEPRTHWIVNLLVGKHPDILSEIHLGEDMATAASREDWERERAQLSWPHLQAYWLMHHAVFRDHEALAAVLEVADRRYPGVADLASMAEEVLAGEPVSAAFWNADRVNEVRLNALEQRPELLTEAARAAVEAENEAVFAANAQVEAALAVLGEEEENERVVGFLGFLQDAAGKLEAYQEALARNMEKDIDYIMAMKKGTATSFEQIYRNMEVLPERIEERPSRGEPLRAFFEAAVVRGADSPDDHPSTLPGGLYGLALLTVEDAAGFEAFLERVRGMGFFPERFGPYRRLQVAMLAARYLGESPAAKAFLRQEAARYAAQSDGWSCDTFDFADRILTEAGDEQQLKAIGERLQNASFSGANWKESIGLARRFLAAPSPVVADGLKAAVEKGLGRHDDGDRAIVVRAYARCAGAEARPVLEDWLANIEDVRSECERAALLAGLIEIDVGTDALESTLEQARAVLPKLRKGSMKVGAALSLLETVFAHGLPGFRDEAAAMAKAAEKEDYGSDALKAWIAEKASEFTT